MLLKKSPSPSFLPSLFSCCEVTVNSSPSPRFLSLSNISSDSQPFIIGEVLFCLHLNAKQSMNLCFLHFRWLLRALDCKGKTIHSCQYKYTAGKVGSVICQSSWSLFVQVENPGDTLSHLILGTKARNAPLSTWLVWASLTVGHITGYISLLQWRKACLLLLLSMNRVTSLTPAGGRFWKL